MFCQKNDKLISKNPRGKSPQKNMLTCIRNVATKSPPSIPLCIFLKGSPQFFIFCH